jgi:hypothetical protein
MEADGGAVEPVPARAADGVRVAFWNRQHMRRPSATLDRLDQIPDWDFVLMVECTQPFVDSARSKFGAERVRSALDHHQPDQEKPNGAAIIMGTDVEVEDETLTFPPADNPFDPRPERSLTVRINVRAKRITAVATHVMNTYDGYERKMRTYERLSALATGEKAFVLGLDGNNWYDWLGDGDPPSIPPGPEDHAETNLFHGRHPAHGLRDSLRVAIERDPVRQNETSSKTTTGGRTVRRTSGARPGLP